MKLRHIILTGLLGATAYSIYKNRHAISRAINNVTDNVNFTKQQINNIKNNLEIIQEQVGLIQHYSKDLTQQWRYFDVEKNARLAEINRVLSSHNAHEN